MDSISTKNENDLTRPNKPKLGKKLSRQWQLILMSVPMVCYVLLFNYGPLWGWITAFQDYKPKLGITGSKFVGWKNFTWLFGRKEKRLLKKAKGFPLLLINQRDDLYVLCT